MTKKKKKKNAKQVEFKTVLPQMTQPHIESFIYGFLQSRGFDLYPRVRETKDGWKIALYFDRGERGWWRVFQLELGGKQDPTHFALSVALSNHLYSSGVQPRTPAPVGEMASKMLRNEILGQLQDGINPELAVQMLNNISGHLTRHLRPNTMKIDFGDGVEPGTEEAEAEEPVETEEEADPFLEKELADLEKAIDDEEETDGAPPLVGDDGNPLEIDDELAEEIAEALVDDVNPGTNPADEVFED